MGKVRITDKDITGLVIAYQTNKWRQFDIMRHAKLIEAGYIAEKDDWWTLTTKGLEVIQPRLKEIEDREQKRLRDSEIRKNKTLELIDALKALGVNADEIDSGYYPDSDDYHVIVGFIRIDHSYFDNEGNNYDPVGKYVTSVMRTGKITMEELKDQARQAQVACDYLNAKLKGE